MIQTDCPNCGLQVSYFAQACSHCGAPNPARRTAFIGVAVLSTLTLAVLAVMVLLTAGPSDRGKAEQRAAAAGDFGWLETALKECDAEAGKSPDALHFLVTPLADEPRDDPGWRRISLNDIGNAILINSDDMLAGLRRKALLLSTQEYTFSIRVESTNEILSWQPANGVKKFVYEEATGITAFQVQFQPRGAGRVSDWGVPFKRVPGNCYWVNAILRH